MIQAMMCERMFQLDIALEEVPPKSDFASPNVYDALIKLPPQTFWISSSDNP